MATFTPTNSNTVTSGNTATFVPEIWSDEIIAAYQKSLKMAPLVKKMSMSGKKGDVIHIPKPARGVASAKAKDTVDAVNIQQTTNTELTITIDRHFEYSRLIEDIVEVQSLNSLRQFYTSDAGYALAVQVDTDLINCATGFGDGNRVAAPSAATDWVNPNSYSFGAATGLDTFAAGSTTSGDDFTDDGFREAIRLMDDADVPMENRVMIIPPSVRKTIMAESRYVSSDFVSGTPVQTGLIGNLYGVDIYVSSNAPTLEANVRGCLFFHQDAIVMAEQMAVRSQTQYKQEFLSTLYTADTLYGVEVYRPEAGFVLAVFE